MDAGIEAIGTAVAMAYERAQGRQPEDVSSENLGYDICSLQPSTAQVRYIEVQARASTSPIELTPNEWLMAQRLGEDYWLYTVGYAATQPALHTLQNPAAKLQPEEEVQIVRYIVKDWKQGVSDLPPAAEG